MAEKPAPSSVLVLLAHPDDEVFLLPHLFWWHRNEIPVSILYASRSEGRRGKYKLPGRLAESRRFLRSAGLGTLLLQCVDAPAPDGKLHMFAQSITAWIDSNVAPRSMICSPAYEGGHQDHDSLMVVSSALASRWRAGHITFPLYRASRGLPFAVASPPAGGSQALTVPLSPRIRMKMSSAFRSFPSQRRTWLALQGPLALRAALTPSWTSYTQGGEQLERPPSGGDVLYARRFGLEWAAWRSAVAPLID